MRIFSLQICLALLRKFAKNFSLASNFKNFNCSSVIGLRWSSLGIARNSGTEICLFHTNTKHYTGSEDSLNRVMFAVATNLVDLRSPFVGPLSLGLRSRSRVRLACDGCHSASGEDGQGLMPLVLPHGRAAAAPTTRHTNATHPSPYLSGFKWFKWSVRLPDELHQSLAEHGLG